MSLDIARHGDVLEQNYLTIIREKIPAYEEIWKRYIGNNGNAQIISIEDLPDEENNKRIIFSQYHYSAFESIVCISHIIEEVDQLPLDSISNYLKLNNCFLAFQAHAGRIRDCVKKMGEIFNLDNLHFELEEYYQQRNEVLHGSKVPFMIIDGFYAIPKIKGIAEDIDKWHDKMCWGEIKAKEDNFKFLYDHLVESFSNITALLNKCLFNILPEIIKIVEQYNIDLTPSEDERYEIHTTISGLYENHFCNVLYFQTSGSTATIA